MKLCCNLQAPLLLDHPRSSKKNFWLVVAWKEMQHQAHAICLNPSELNLLGSGFGLLPVALCSSDSAGVSLVHASLGIGEGLVDGLGGSLGS